MTKKAQVAETCAFFIVVATGKYVTPVPFGRGSLCLGAVRVRHGLAGLHRPDAVRSHHLAILMMGR